MTTAQNIEGYLPIPGDLTAGDAFALRVRDDSLSAGGIRAGDFLLIHRQEASGDGTLVVARFQEATTVGRLYRDGNHIRLQPVDRRMPQVAADARDLVVGGKVVGVLRRFS